MIFFSFTEEKKKNLYDKIRCRSFICHNHIICSRGKFICDHFKRNDLIGTPSKLNWLCSLKRKFLDHYTDNGGPCEKRLKIDEYYYKAIANEQSDTENVCGICSQLFDKNYLMVKDSICNFCMLTGKCVRSHYRMPKPRRIAELQKEHDNDQVMRKITSTIRNNSSSSTGNNNSPSIPIMTELSSAQPPQNTHKELINKSSRSLLKSAADSNNASTRPDIRLRVPPINTTQKPCHVIDQCLGLSQFLYENEHQANKNLGRPDTPQTEDDTEEKNEMNNQDPAIVRRFTRSSGKKMREECQPPVKMDQLTEIMTEQHIRNVTQSDHSYSQKNTTQFWDLGIQTPSESSESSSGMYHA